MNFPIPVTRADIVQRARSVIGRGLYKLGAGGRVPANATPFDAQYCDCSGFVAWCCGVDRYQPKTIAGEWIETSAMVTDALNVHALFKLITPCEPGDILVYGDRHDRGNVTEGHTGIISAVDEAGHPLAAIHCSHGNQRAFGHAVIETGAEIFTKHAALSVRFVGAVE